MFSFMIALWFAYDPNDHPGPECFNSARLAQAATEEEHVLKLSVEQLINTTTEGRKRRLRSMLMLIGLFIKTLKMFLQVQTGIGKEERATLLKHSSKGREERNGGEE